MYPGWNPFEPGPGTVGYLDPLIASKRGSDIQEVSVTDLISEGPIEGLVNGEASVYLAGDQLADRNRILKESSKAEETGEPHTITFAAASGLNQPVTASLKDRQGNTAYFNDLAETYSSDYVYRWITIISASSSKAKVERIVTKTLEGPATIHTIGSIRLCAVASTSPFAETTFFDQDFKPTLRGGEFSNLKPICRVKLPSGETLKGDLISTHDTGYDSELNSGDTKRAIFKPYNTTINAQIIPETYASGTNEVYAEVFIDWVLKVEIQTVNTNNVIYIPKSSNALAVTDKEFTLGGEVGVLGSSTTGGSPRGGQKYPGSSIEFRVGNRIQEPFYQIAGQGVASFPVTLSSAQAEIFNNTNSYPTTIGVGYPDVDPVPTGMVQKIIVFSTSFTSAQINEIDRIKVHFEFPGGHYAMDEEGNDFSGGAAFNIQLQGSETGGANPTDWKDLTGGAFKYQKWFGLQKTAISYTVEIPVNTFLNIQDMRLQITRLTPDGQSNSNNHTGKLNGQGYIVQGRTSGVSAVIDSVKIAQVIAIIDEKLEHPYSAMASVRFSSKSFSNPPKRSYHVRGLKVKIPSNYTPRHLTTTGVATYTGLWNGEFSDEGTSNSSSLDLATYYTDNPAWIFYDILINNRYGLGDFLAQTDINKFQLYKIAKYCDELVPTRDGGTEPRFTTNLYLTKSAEAYKVLKDMATVFRGMLYWLDGQMSTVQDSPATPIYNFSEANILEGTLSTQNTASKTRANQFTVLWNNPLSAYKAEPLIIEDRDNIIETGRVLPAKAVAFGCTSEGQAIRFGRWKAWTAVNQTEIVTFKTSTNASFLAPGDIINLQNKVETGVSFSGRITASSNSAITLDRNVASLSSEAQVEGGNAESFSFQAGSDYTYTLSLLVMKRTVVLAQDASATVTHGGTAYTYNRGDTVTYGKIAGTSTQLIGTNDSDEQVEKNILNIQDDAGNDILVEFRNSTSVEAKSFTSSNVTIVNGVSQIALSSAFSGTIPDSTVWAIKETFKGVNTLPSYKEYKILSIKQDKDNNHQITGVEFYNSKFDVVDKDLRVAIQDPVRTPEPDTVPQPEAVYVFETPMHKQQLQELQVMWETPLNSDGTEYGHLSSFALHIHPKLPDGTDLIDITNASRRFVNFSGIPDGIYNFGVQTISKEGKRSEIKWQVIEVQDKFAVSCIRTADGVPNGIRSNSKMSSSTSTWSMNVVDWAMQSPGAPGTKVNNANQSTAATYQQSLTALADGDHGFIYFDADSTSDYFKLVSSVAIDFENTSQGYWRDLTQYAANAENDWTDCTNNADARVTVAARTNKVVKSEGTTAFTTRFEVGDIIRIKYATDKYIGGKVTFIQDDDTLYVDRRLNDTDSTVTSVDEAKAIARNTLRTDTANDAIIARVSRSGSNYTHTPINWIEDTTLTGLRALIVDSNIVFLNYNSSSALQGEAVITLVADAIAYDAPEFTITGNGFTQGSPAISASAQSSFIGSSDSAVTGQTLTYQLHDGSGGIGYDSGSSLDFTVTVRETSDQSNSKSKSFKIIKVKDGASIAGAAGADGKIVNLTSDDYSIVYDEEGSTPVYNSSGSNNIVITATANNFTDPLYRFTFDGTVGAWTDTTGTQAATYTYASASIPATYVKANWPKVVKVEVGEKPGSYSAGDAPSSVVATDSISIVGIKIGSGGVAIVNSNQAHTYTTDLSGKIGGADVATIPGSSTTLELIVGGEVYSYVGGSGAHSYNNLQGTLDNGEWYIGTPTVTGSDVTIGTPSGVSSNVVTIGNHSTTANTDTDEVITWPIIYKQANANAKTINTTQTLSKSITGDTGQTGASTKVITIYKLAATDGAAQSFPDNGTPGGTTGTAGTINFDSGTITWTNSASESNDWYAAPQKTTTAKPYLHQRQVTITDASANTTINAHSWNWSAGAVIAVHGDQGSAGDSGKRSVQGYIYFRTTNNTNPFSSGGTGTYSFSAGGITGNLSTGLAQQATAAGGYSNNFYVVEIDSDDHYWVARYSFTDGSSGATSNTVTVNITAAVEHTSFTGVVTFSGGTFSEDGSSVYDTTAIDGAHITTGTIQGPNFGNTGGTNGGGSKILLTLPGADSDSVFETRNKAGTAVFKITKAGNITADNFTFNTGSIANAVSIGGTTATNLHAKDGNKEAGEVGGWTIAANTITGTDANGSIVLESNNRRIIIKEGNTTRVKLGDLS